MGNQVGNKEKFNKQAFFKTFGILIIFLVLVVVLSILSPNFAKPKNLINILKQTSINGILAMGMTFVILSGGFDLSVGSTVGLCGVVAALFAQGNYPLIVPFILVILVGMAVGMANGIGVAYGELPPFVITLGSMTIVRGLALIVSKGAPITGVSDEFAAIASGSLFGIPYLAYYFLIVVLICAFILSKTIFGRRVYAVGGNSIAARVSGINVNKIKVAVYTISGMLAGICGLILASRTTVGGPTAGESYEMDAISAVVIGGVSMSGGSGKCFGVVIGALLLSVIANGLDILGVSAHYQKVIKGAIIVVAVLADVKGKKKRS